MSISAQIPDAAKDLMIYFYKLYFSTASLQMASSKQPYALEDIEALKKLFCGQDYRKDFMLLKSMLANMEIAIPTLYKQYTELCEPGGVRFLDFGVDPEFSGCVDGLVLVDTQQLKDKKRKRYIETPM